LSWRSHAARADRKSGKLLESALPSFVLLVHCSCLEVLVEVTSSPPSLLCIYL
jgi:hypothetical protein